ncbi:sulfatase family protein [Rhodococcus sp. MTM3W5.2]|nr:sulfatase family protein [Rhodococcus sp. MTM3W5.2]
MADVKDKLGTVEAYNHYSVGWAWAMCSPFQWTKQVASHWGGTRNGTIVHWPDGINSKGEIRSQFTHVIDVAATVLEAAGLPEPTFVNGVQQAPIEGTSMLYSFDDAAAPERHDLQYFEMAGNRGIYHKGWSAVTRHSTPGCRMRSCPRSTTTCGSSTTAPPTGPRPTIWPPRCPRNLPSCSGCG